MRLADAAWRLAQFQSRERDLIRAARIKGTAELHLGDLASGERSLQEALTRARSVGFVQEELAALSALAELNVQRNQYDAARGLLEQVWSPAERGPYPIWHADACNVLAGVQAHRGDIPAAVEAASTAYRLAWCDGPPYAYHYGLTAARRHLQELASSEPQLPPFDPTQFSPMPDLEPNWEIDF